MIKIAIVVVLLLILGALGRALFFIVKDKSQTDRTVKALTLRIALSLLLFISVILALYFGVLTPGRLP